MIASYWFSLSLPFRRAFVGDLYPFSLVRHRAALNEHPAAGSLHHAANPKETG